MVIDFSDSSDAADIYYYLYRESSGWMGAKRIEDKEYIGHNKCVTVISSHRSVSDQMFPHSLP